jgi:hypothetical protein
MVLWIDCRGQKKTHEAEASRVASLLDLSERLQIFARLETNRFTWSDGDLGARARVAADAGLAGLDSKHAKAAQFNAVAAAQSVLHGFEDGIHGGFRLCPWKPCALNYPLD